MDTLSNCYEWISGIAHTHTKNYRSSKIWQRWNDMWIIWVCPIFHGYAWLSTTFFSSEDEKKRLLNEIELLKFVWIEFCFLWLHDRSSVLCNCICLNCFILLIVIKINGNVTTQQTIVWFDVCICFSNGNMRMKAFGVVVSHFMKTIWRSQHNSIK